MNEAARVQNLADVAGSQAAELARFESLELGGLKFDRATFEPGWRWSEHAAAASCPERHLGYLVAGRLHFRMDDGAHFEARAGDVYLIPPGHDAWVVGSQPCVALDMSPVS